MIGTLQAGSIIGSYEIQRVIGVGRTGQVLEAHQSPLGRGAAIRVLDAALARDAETVERFRYCCVQAARLQHPHIVSIYDAGTQDGLDYVIMELFKCQHLGKRPLPLGPSAAVAAVLQIGDAVAYAHRQGMAHGHLCPQNVFMDGSAHVTVTDFGFQVGLIGSRSPVEAASENRISSPGAAKIGVPDSGPRQDLWAVGLLLQFLLTGSMPRDLQNDRPVCAGKPPGYVPPDLQRWIGWCGGGSPGGYASVDEAMAGLRQCAVGPAVPTNTLVRYERSDSEPAAVSTTALTPVLSGAMEHREPIIRSAWTTWYWMGLFTGAALDSIFQVVQIINAIGYSWFSVTSWIAAILMSWHSWRRGALLGPHMLALSIMGMIFAGNIWGHGIMWSWLTAAAWAAAAAVGSYSGTEPLRLKQQQRQRAFVVLEPVSGHELPAAARDRLLDLVSRTAQDRGFRKRQLGLRAAGDTEDGSLALSVEAFDRDTDRSLAHAQIHGSLDDAENLAEDVAKRLQVQIKQVQV